jgi:hypothetical protein
MIMVGSLLCGTLEMRVDAISFLGDYGAIAVVWDFGDEDCCDRIFEVLIVRSLLCEILEMRVDAIAF